MIMISNDEDLQGQWFARTRPKPARPRMGSSMSAIWLTVVNSGCL